MTPYQRGQKDAQSGHPPQWRYSGNQDYMKGHLDGSLRYIVAPSPGGAFFD